MAEIHGNSLGENASLMTENTGTFELIGRQQEFK